MSAFYGEFRSYSPLTDSDLVRISMWDKSGSEFFMLVPDSGSSKIFRAARQSALEAIMTAMEQGLQPGEVRIQ